MSTYKTNVLISTLLTQLCYLLKHFVTHSTFQVQAPIDPAHSVAIAAVEASTKCLASAIVVITTSGRSAHLLSKYRPRCPVIAVTRLPQTARQAHLYRGVLPIVYESES